MILFYFINRLNLKNFSHELSFYDEELNEIRRKEFVLPFDTKTGPKEDRKICRYVGCIDKLVLSNTCRLHQHDYNISVAKKLSLFIKIGYTHYLKNPVDSVVPLEKRKKTTLCRYGVEHVLQSEEVKKSSKKTNLDRYGVEYAIQSPEVRSRAKATLFDNYGVENPYQSVEIQGIIKKKIFDRYGVEHQMQSKSVRDKSKSTNVKRRGVEYSLQCPKIISVSLKTKSVQRYGVPDLMDLREPWRKVFLKEGLITALAQFPMVSRQTSFIHFIEHDEKGNGSIIQDSAQKQLEKLSNIHFESNVRSIVTGNNRLEIDMLNREHKLSIEFNGIYWHRELYVSDLSKAEAMRSVGYRHFVIDETTVQLIPKIAKMIAPNKTRVYARKCEIVQLNSKASKKFMDENHLQGNVGASIRYGLMIDFQIVQIMTFGKSRFDKSHDYEIIRLATRSDSIVVGGAERLFAHFRKRNNGSIVSYSDNRFFDGAVYKRLGMKYNGNTTPGYQWSGPNGTFKRYQTMKHKLPALLGNEFDIQKTEAENMQSSGYVKIQDLGQKKWTLEIEETKE